MALANDMSKLLGKIEKRLGLLPLTPHLPKFAQKDKWSEVIMEDTMETFSRFYPHRFPMVVNDETCIKYTENGTTYYQIKDEVLAGVKLLGMMDIDWQDHSQANSSLGATSIGGGYYYPNFGCIESTFETVLG